MNSGAPPQTVLVVDDDEGIRLLIVDALQAVGYSVASAGSGHEALEWLGNHGAALMLLDLKMADLTGPTLVRRLRDTGISVPFIIVTGQGDERVAVEMMKEGALDYLVKDTRMVDRLPAVVHRSLRQVERDQILAETQAALKAGEKEILAISEREQRRFGEDLHDGLGQELTAIEFLCESLKGDLRQHNPGLVARAEQICQFLREAISHTRSLARGLSPVNMTSRGLMDALDALARQTTAVGRISCAFNCPAPVLIEDSTTANHLFRIAQEAVNNALKHSEASALSIRLGENDRSFFLEISDNGKGLRPTKEPHSGMGQRVMRHRATVIGGSLEVRTPLDGGVTIACILPKPHETSDQSNGARPPESPRRAVVSV